MNEHIIRPIAYFPPLGYLAKDSLNIEAHEHYQKGSIRNRCSIAHSKGTQLLTIPLKGGKNQQTPIKEVKVDHSEPWIRNHWRSIKTSYGKSPYWQDYQHELNEFYDGVSSEYYLWDISKKSIELSYEFLQLDVNIQETQNFETTKNNLWAIPTENDGISKNTYLQVFSHKYPFIPNLSIIDAIFCLGPESIYLINA
jgi:hypothetical protein